MIEIKYREVEVRGLIFKVPTNINAAKKGWQVRFATAPERNKFFQYGDTVNGLRASFKQATQWAMKYRPPPKTQVKEGKGIRLHYDERKDVMQFWWEVSAIVQGNTPKRFYVGTSRTATSERFKEVRKKAMAYRERAVMAHTKSVERRRAQSVRQRGPS